MIKIKIESIISPNIQIRNRHREENIQLEQLEKYELGKRYPDFNMIEPFVEEYDTDITSLSEGDIIVRDWQFGHLKNTGYRALKIVEEFDGVSITVEDSNGYQHRICVDPLLMKDKVFHKLDKSKLSK